MLDEPNYRQRAKEVSVLFRDNPIDPMEEAMYWIEYAARHKGAKDLQSSAVHMPWYIYYHLDIMAVLLTLLYFTFKIAFYIIRLTISLQETAKHKYKCN